MFLEIEIEERWRRRGKRSAVLELEEGKSEVKMRWDKRPEFGIPDCRMLRRRPHYKSKTDGSASFLRAARAGNLEKVLEFLKTNTDIDTCNANGLNALHLASKEGHVNVVRELLQRGANVDAATKKGNTALHIASLAGQEEIVKVLVQHQALVNIQSQNGFTPLYMAAQENHDSVVRFLLANNANQSLATEDGFTPLAVALQQGHDKVVAVLLENDTRGKVRLPALHIAAKKDDTKAAALLLHTDHNPDVTSKSGFTPLHIAAHYGNENIANLLIQRGADVNYIAKHQITPLHVASKWGKGNMVSLLIDKGANYEAKTRDGLTPLHCAARSGHETVVDMLLEKGAPITSKTKNGLAPLHMASQGDHVDAARILLYHKAPVDDVTVDFLTALHVAAHCGHVRVAKLLLDRKADPNSRALNGFTPLHIACKKNRIKVVELLLKHGASIEATTESGLTPLHVASFMGCMNIVIYLIQHGASADVPTVRGETPLHLAARANQTDIIRILLRNGAQVDARAREQQTALHIASRLGNSDIVVLLLQHGAAVDATTKDHYTALHIAAKEGQEEVASVLLEHGASLTSTTKKGFTPLHLAAKYGNMKVARLLLQKDAPVDAQGKNGVTPLHVAAHYDHQNVALLLLDKGASPHATAKNGYTPLHIAARKNQMDIATTLLEYGASSNAESKAGFTPLHLSSQEGHTDMATLLIEHNAAPGACAKNGLTPLHLCAQEDRVNVAAILVKHGAQIDPATKAGYTPLHVACHFGQMNMVRFLLQHGAKVDSTTQLGYTPLHQAAQQGHTQIVNLLLENKAEPNTETNDGKTALSIAQRLGYISVVETLKIVTETTINTTTTTVTEEKYKVVVPETMHETFMSESEDEGGDDNLVSSMFGKQQHVTLPFYEGQLRYTSDDTMLGDQSYRYLTVDEMKSLGDDSLPIDVTKDEKMDVSFISNTMAAPPVAPADQLSPQHQKEQHYAQFTGHYPSDNVDVAKTPILAGFLVSFMVDARGGAMRGCRHSGVRVIIPPRKAAMPMRVTCRYLKKDKLVHAPPLMEGEALASRILEMGPAGAKFLGPVIIEVPHFASLRGKEREIVILRSDNGETWREHTLEATEEAVQEVLNESFDGEELKQLEDLNTNRITRILTTDFPQYFAIVTRIRQEVHAIGPEGGMVSSTVVPQVQAVFPQGALTKKIKVGLQAQPIPTDLVAKLLGNRVAVSPIVTVEPRRRKFHKPITLTIPVPQASSKGMINQYSGEAPTLRLLCSITGGTTRAQWEDVTGSTPLTFVNDCVSFTTTVSARFWLMDCSNIPEATKMATELYREAIHVPFMAKFVVFSKRHQLEEARVRVFCMTDDREDKTLEHQELFVEVAKSRDVEVLEGKPQFLEFAGNLVPVTKSGDQLAFNFYAFRENRLPFTVRVKDQHADPIGRVAFMRQPKVGRGDPPQTPICNLNIALPDNIQPEPAPSEPDLLALEKKYSFLSISKADTIHKADLRLTDISNMLGTDWVALAHELEISDSDINIIKSQYPDNAPQQAIVMLRLWMQTSGNKANGNTLEKGLRKIRRDDIVNQCIFNVELVTDDIERAMAKAHLDQSGFETFKEELGPSRDTTLNRDVSLDVSYDEQDMMKEAESAEEEEENQRAYQEKSSREQRTVDMSPTYESEEKKYAGEEKVVTEEKVTREELRDGSSITISTTSTTVIKEPTEKSKLDTVIKETTKVEPIEEMKLDSTKEQIVPEPIKEQIVPEPIKEQIIPEPIKEQIVPEPIKEIVPEPMKEHIAPEPIKEQVVPEPIKEVVPEPIKEQIVPEPIKETKVEPSVTESVALKPVEGSATVTEEIISEEPLNILEESKTEFTVAEAEKDMIEKYEQLLEQEALEKPIFKITKKPAEVKEKIQVVDDAPEDIGASEVEDSKEIQTTVVRESVSGPEGTPTSTTTTHTETHTTSEDGTVQEHIVVTKQITKTVGGLELDEEDKSLMLQKLGEELGRLDEKLEEKFREKRKTDEPEVTQEEVKEEAVVAMRREGHAQPTSQVVVEYGSLPSTLSVTTTTTTTTSSITPTPDGFTQTSVESSQMSSTRGTAEVSFPGTTTTADESLKQMGQALTQQTAPQHVDRRVAHDDPLQQEVSQQHSTHKEQAFNKTAAPPDDSAKSGQTEERGCSPITVLEARPEMDQGTVRPLSRGSSHTITTTTSWGAPVSTTTNIQLCDNESAHCVQLTLHSESRVTLHAPEEIWEELRNVRQQQEQQQAKHQHQQEQQEQQQQPEQQKHQQPEQQKQQQPEQQKQQQQQEHQQQQQQELHEKVSRVEMGSKTVDETSEIIPEQKGQHEENLLHPEEHISISSGKDDEIIQELQASTVSIKERINISDGVIDSLQSLTDHELAESITVSAESIIDPYHESQDPCKNISADILESTSVIKNDELMKSVNRQMCKEMDVSNELKRQITKEKRAKVEDLSPKENTGKDLAMPSKEAVENDNFLLPTEIPIEISTESSWKNLARNECEDPAALSEDHFYVANEVIAPSAHRPTTLMITSNSNESTDDAECMANDPTRNGRENDIPQDLKREGSSMVVMEESEQQGMGIVQSAVVSERLSGSESGAVPRAERPVRPAPRTTTLLKVKVEKRPVGSHPQVRERIAHEHQTVVRAPSVEEEMRGLMQEVKEATSQIKQEVKELRQADTPTPDTPTPLREFKEFLNREEEQEQERLPTIKEICRENEEDAFVSTGGEHLCEDEQFKLGSSVAVQECFIPEQVVQSDFGDTMHPNSRYSSLEGYYAVSVNPSQAAKYTPFSSEMVPEEYFDECRIKSELESPSSPVDNSDFCPVDSISSAISPDGKQQGQSKLKSFLRKVCKLTSKGLHKPESRKVDDHGENVLDRDSEIPGTASCKSEILEKSGLKLNNHNGMKSPSYELISVVEPDTVKNKHDEREKSRIGEKKPNEICVKGLEEPVVDPSNEVANFSVKGNELTEMGDLQSAISDSLIIKATNTEFPVLESEFSKTCKFQSPVFELPLITQAKSVCPVLELPHTLIPPTKSPELEVTHTEMHHIRSSEVALPLAEGHHTESSQSECQNNKVPIGDLAVFKFPPTEVSHIRSTEQLSPHTEAPHTKPLVSEFTLPAVPHTGSSAPELTDIKIPHIEYSVSKLPGNEVPLMESSISELPRTKMLHTAPSDSELPDDKVSYNESSSELPQTKLALTEHLVSELPYIGVPLSQFIVSELLHDTVPHTEFSSLKLPHLQLPELQRAEPLMPESLLAEVPNINSSVTAGSHTESLAVEPFGFCFTSTEPLLSDESAATLSSGNSLFIVSQDPQIQTVPALCEIRENGSKEVFSHSASDVHMSLPVQNLEKDNYNLAFKDLEIHSQNDEIYVTNTLAKSKAEIIKDGVGTQVLESTGSELSTAETPVIQSKRKSLLSESFTTIKHTVTGFNEDLISKTVSPEIYIKDKHRVEQFAVKPEQSPDALASDADIDNTFNFSVKADDGSLDVSEDDLLGERTQSESFTEEDIHVASLAGFAKICPLSRGQVYEDDDYIEFPNSDVVEILETVFEIDETEDINDCNVESKENQSHIETIKETEYLKQLQIERSNTLYFEDKSNVYDDHDEIQLLSEADIKAMNEFSGLLKEPRSDIEQCNEAEFAAIPESYGLQENQEMGESLMMMNSAKEAVGLKELGIESDFNETQDSNFSRTLCKADEIEHEDEASKDEYIAPFKILHEDITPSGRFLGAATSEPNEEKGIDIREIYNYEESKDVDNFLTRETLFFRPVHEKYIKITCPENESDDEGLSSSVAGQTQVDEESIEVATSIPSEQVREEGLHNLSPINETVIIPKGIMSPALVSERDDCDPSQHEEQVVEDTSEMETMRYTDFSFIKRGSICEPEEKNPLKVISHVSECSETKELQISASGESHATIVHSVIQVIEADEAFEPEEIEDLPSLETMLVKQLKQAHLVEAETFITSTVEQVVACDAPSKILLDVVDINETSQSKERIKLHHEEVDQANYDTVKSQAFEIETNITFSEDDFMVLTPNIEGADTLLKPSQINPAIATRLAEPDQYILRTSEPLRKTHIQYELGDIAKSQDYLPVINDTTNILVEGETENTSVSQKIEEYLSNNEKLSKSAQYAESEVTTDSKNVISDQKEHIPKEHKTETLLDECDPLQLQSILGGGDMELSLKLDIKESEPTHLESVTQKIKENNYRESLADEKQFLEADMLVTDSEMALLDTHNGNYSQIMNREEVSVIDNIIHGPEQMSPNHKLVQDAQVAISGIKLDVSVKEANVSLDLTTDEYLHQDVKLKPHPPVSENAQVTKCKVFRPVELKEYKQDAKHPPDESIRYGRLESESENKLDELFVDAPPELSSIETEVSEKITEDKRGSCLVTPIVNKNIYVLNSVSEELKTIIFELEQNLFGASSTDIMITPILARLEQMEQEVVNLDSIPKAPESSIPVSLLDVQIDDVVSTSQASPSTEQELEIHSERLNLGESDNSKVTMPVGLGTESSTLTLPRGHSPGGEINGQNIQDALTDVEDLFSDGDQSPLLKTKSLLLTSQKETGAITDTEDTDLSGEEDDIIQEEKDVPTIQELGLLPEPNKDIINLTEGYAREASPLLHSDSEPESEAIQGKHKKNIKKIDQLNQPDTSANDDPECLTDVEDMLASGDEAAVAIVEVEDTLPDHYLDQNEGVSDKERLEAPSTSPKVLLTRGEDSSGDEKVILRQPRHKCKGNLKVKANEEGTTDVEDLELSDKGDGKENLETCKNKSKDKIRKMKRNRRKTAQKKSIGKMLKSAVDDSNGLTDVEILSGDEDQEVLEDEEFDLKVPETEMGILTDSEDVELSDPEEVADLLAKPLDKVEVPLMPDPQCEKIQISEVQEASQEDSGGETDQEGFEFSKKDYAKPLNPRQKVVYEPIVAEVEEAPDIDEGTYEAVLTDTEDLDINEKEEEEVITDIISRIPKEREIYTITEMESFNGQITKKEMMKDVHAEAKQQIQNVDYTGLAVQEDFEDNSQTDVEDLEDSGEHGKVDIKIIPDDTSKKEEGLTDEESVDESDIDEEIQEPAKQKGRKGKRLPLVPQVSEVRFIETDQGPLSIIITPDIFESSQRQVPKDQITNVVFLESEEKDEATTDIEDLSDGEEEKTPPNLKVPQNKQEPTTDTEDFDIDPSEVDRPHSPLPPNIKYNVLPSPKRELIHIKEDKYGIPQVTVQKLEKDELFVSDIEDLGATDTEDIEVTEEEALRLVGVTEDTVSDFEFSDAGTTEVTTKMTHKIQSRHVEPEEGGGTDVEELPATRKPQCKVKAHSKFMPKEQEDDGHTDTELLSDQDEKEKLPVRLESPGGHTDVEDFETSENEELEVPDREDGSTPDIIRDAAIRKMIIQKEGLGGTTYTEDAHVAPDCSNLLGVEGESGGITDVEDMEVSGAEDEIIPDHPAVDMPEYETSSVDISEKTSIPSGSNEAKHIKDNLLLPEDNFNNLTDVESLGEGEGNRDP